MVHKQTYPPLQDPEQARLQQGAQAPRLADDPLAGRRACNRRKAGLTPP
jgi:hypothetical protein